MSNQGDKDKKTLDWSSVVINTNTAGKLDQEEEKFYEWCKGDRKHGYEIDDLTVFLGVLQRVDRQNTGIVGSLYVWFDPTRESFCPKHADGMWVCSSTDNRKGNSVCMGCVQRFKSDGEVQDLLANVELEWSRIQITNRMNKI